MRTQWKKKIKVAGILALSLILVLMVFLFVVEMIGKRELLGRQDENVEISSLEAEEILSEEDGEVITYKGDRYLYNENITSVLCMGVDKESIENTDQDIGNAGQADMLMLAVLDTKTGDVKLWNISRDSMTDVDIYNIYGDYVKTEKMQACLAFAYGDGEEKSCENTVRAVSRLLYGMPIQSYAVLDMDAILPLNDAIGGVEVTIHEGDILPPKFKAGTTMLLQGENVDSYVRFRRTEMPDEPIDSNNNRMARQRQYMMNFIQKALEMTRKDLTVPVKLFNIAKQGGHIITDLSAAKIMFLTTIFSKVNFTEDSFQTVPGEVVDGGEYAEYHVDDEALYQMILDTFYIKQ